VKGKPPYRFPLLGALLALLCVSAALADSTWERFPTSAEIQQAWKKHFAELEAAWPGHIRRENLREIRYHDPTVEDPVAASGVIVTYNSLEIVKGDSYAPPENEYYVLFLGYGEGDGWYIKGSARKFNSSTERGRFVSSIFQRNPPSLQGFHTYGLNDRTGQYEGRDRKGAAFQTGWPDPKQDRSSPPPVVDRVTLSVKKTTVDEPWKDASGRDMANVVVEASVKSDSPIVSTSFYRIEPDQKQGHVKIQGENLVAEGEVIQGRENKFVLAVYNEADQNAERSITISASGQIGQQAGTDQSGEVVPSPDFVEEALESLPAMEGPGKLPPPGSTLQAVTGVIVPGVISILIGVLAGPKGSDPLPDTPDTPPSSFPPGTEHVLSDGRTYREGESYIFHDGVEYETRGGDLVPKRELEQGERFVDPDGEERVWQGNQAWIPSDWERQELTNQEYAAAHKAEWEVESKQVDPRMAEAMQAIKDDAKMLENLEKMRHQAIFGPREVTVLGKDTPGGGFRGKIDRIVAGFEASGRLDREAYQQIRGVYEKARTGKIAGDSELHSERQIFANTLRAGTDAVGREVFTGVDSEGNISYKGMAVRILTAGLTGGSSELVYTPASSVYTMKDYVDKGGDSVVGGFVQTSTDVLLGEVIGLGMGKGVQFLGKGVGRVAGAVGDVAEKTFPKATRAVSQRVKKVVDVLTRERRSPFAAKVQPPPKIPAKVSPRPSRSEVMERLKQYKADRARSTAPGLELNEGSFKPAGKAADLRGVPLRDQKAIRMVAEKHGVKAHFRPTNPDSKPWLESGRAHPKPEMLKTKTISHLDAELGFPKNKVGTVACKKPVMPSKRPAGMTDVEFDDLCQRFDQRSAEFLDQQTKLDALVEKGEIIWNKETGEILNAKTGKPFAGDHDPFAFVDAVTGKPVSPAVNNQINQDLQNLGTTAHGEHVAWDYSKLDKTLPADAPPGAQAPYDNASGIDQKILGSHQEGGQALNTFNPLEGEKGGWSSSFWNGGTRDLP
jgi:hypothetical protein